MATVDSTARFGELSVSFVTSQYGEVSRSIVFCAPVQVGEDDLVAALWLVSSNWSWGDLAELAAVPVRVRAAVAEALVNAGLESVDEARHEVAAAAAAAGTTAYAWLQEIQNAVRVAFASVLPGPASRRVLVGVA